MPKIRANGLEMEYQSLGDEKDETVLLIMGLGAQMTRWPKALNDKLIAAGFRVVSFDNRDVGLSEKLEAAGPPDMGAILQALRDGKKPPAAYTLDEMAADAVGVLDGLGIARAHIVGASMGGMIAQLVAADYPDRVLSLTSIMSTTGNPELPRATPQALAVLNDRGPDPAKDFDGFLAHSIKGSRVVGSPAYPADEAELRDNAAAAFHRCYYPLGFARQYAAVMASPDRRPRLRKITAPTVVVHGEADPLVPLAGGRDTARNIPGAELEVIAGMGHDIPAALHDRIVAAIVRAAERSRVRA
ncbi:MAG TPA: alpha/beta hydrolase [Caulobacteraceae bacterium]